MDIFGVVALKGARVILLALSQNGSLRYSDLQKAVGSPSTTNLALQKLKERSLIQRKVLDEPYRPVAYSLTDLGKKVFSVISELEAIEPREARR